GVLFPSSASGQESLPRIGVGVKASTLGIGIEAATAVTAHSNVRGSFNFYNYDRSPVKDGIHYDGSITFRSVQAMYDQYLHGPFHVRLGVLVYNGNRAAAIASVPGGRSFSLGDVSYFSNPTNPVTGNGTVEFRKIAPMVLFGVGNILPRSHRGFAINFDAGIAFQGSPDLKLNLAGTACAVNPATACVNAATDPIVQTNIRREQAKAADDLDLLKYYPVLSVGFGWRF